MKKKGMLYHNCALVGTKRFNKPDSCIGKPPGSGPETNHDGDSKSIDPVTVATSECIDPNTYALDFFSKVKKNQGPNADEVPQNAVSAISAGRWCGQRNSLRVPTLYNI